MVQDINRGSEQAKDGMQLAVSESETGDEQQFEKRAQFLHDEFKALMDRYRRLKQMSETPEREKETDSLVRVSLLMPLRYMLGVFCPFLY